MKICHQYLLSVGVPFLALLSGCSGALPDDGRADLPTEPVGQVQEAVESALEKRPIAAVFVPVGSGPGYLWIFARGTSNRLYRRIYSFTGLWVESWKLLDSGIADIPSVSLFGDGPEFGLALYARGTDNHIWELYYPDARNVSGEGFWYDVTAPLTYNGSSFGTIKGAPAVAISGFDVTVFAHRASDNQAYSIDWTPGSAWTAQRIDAGGNPITWTGVHTFAVDSDSNLFVGRRGRYEERENTLFSRHPYGGFYQQWGITYDHHDGTMAFDVLNPTTNQVLGFARDGTQLQSVTGDDANHGRWTNYGTCAAAGSPSIGRQQSSKVRFPYYVGTNGQLVASKNSSSCSMLGGSLKSSPTVVQVPWDNNSILDVVLYKGSNNNVWWSMQLGTTFQHADLALALP